MMQCDQTVRVNERTSLPPPNKQKNPEGKESHKKIGPLMNEEGHEINDD